MRVSLFNSHAPIVRRYRRRVPLEPNNTASEIRFVSAPVSFRLRCRRRTGRRCGALIEKTFSVRDSHSTETIRNGNLTERPESTNSSRQVWLDFIAKVWIVHRVTLFVMFACRQTLSLLHMSTNTNYRLPPHVQITRVVAKRLPKVRFTASVLTEHYQAYLWNW